MEIKISIWASDDHEYQVNCYTESLYFLLILSEGMATHFLLSTPKRLCHRLCYAGVAGTVPRQNKLCGTDVALIKRAFDGRPPHLPSYICLYSIIQLFAFISAANYTVILNRFKSFPLQDSCYIATFIAIISKWSYEIATASVCLVIRNSIRCTC